MAPHPDTPAAAPRPPRPRRRRATPHTLDDFVAAMIRELEAVVAASGWRSNEVFNDFLEALYYALRAEPRHVRARAAGLPDVAPDDEAAAFARLRQRYGDHWGMVETHFAHAMAWARQAAQQGVIDVLGPTFERWAWPNPDAGQFLTPPDLSLLLGQVVGGDTVPGSDGAPAAAGVTGTLRANLDAAITATPLAAVMAFFAQAFGAADAARPPLARAGALLLELDAAFAAQIAAQCRGNDEARLVFLLGEQRGGWPDDDEDPIALDQVAARLLCVTDPLGRGLDQVIAQSPSARLLHLWCWAIHAHTPELCGWLLAAIARAVERDEILRQRLCRQLAAHPDLRQIVGADWALDRVSQAERQWRIAHVVIPALPAFTRVTCYDPAAGAATLLLHLAEVVRDDGYAWALDCGLVQFFGQDKDRGMWLMGNANLWLNGLNGHRLRVAQAEREGQALRVERGRAALLSALAVAPPPDDAAVAAAARQLAMIDATLRALRDGDSLDVPLTVSPAAHARACDEVRRTQERDAARGPAAAAGEARPTAA